MSFPEFTREEVKDMKKKLRECKDEWLETKPGGKGKYLGVNTIRQILDNATDSWSFTLAKEWREEVYKYLKDSKQWVFDGYVYHVKGELFIPGLGNRSQYGSKVAVGGKDNQDSAYKAAASNCLNKCASLFGVGMDVYSKIIVEQDETIALQQDPNYVVGNPQQGYVDHGVYNPYGQQMPNQNVPPAMYQQPEQQHWTHPIQPVQQQEMYQQPQQEMYQQPQQNAYQQQPYMHDATAQQLQQPVYQEQTQQPVYQDNVYQMPAPPVVAPSVQETMQQTDLTYQNQQVPFEQPPAQPQSYQAQPQDVNVQYGAPALPNIEPTPAQPEMEIDNPWNQPHILNAMSVLHEHKARLKLDTNTAVIPHIRNYFKDEKADMSSITPENIMLFNDYLSAISA